MQSAFDFDAPDQALCVNRENASKICVIDPDKCENIECGNKHLPGRQMCGDCARLFGAYMQGRILGWKNV